MWKSEMWYVIFTEALHFGLFGIPTSIHPNPSYCSLKLGIHLLLFLICVPLMYSSTYSAGEEKSPYFLFHGETALRKILKFQGETANFSEKFQGEITEFLRENMELYGKILKFQGEIQVFPGENTGFPGETWRNFPLFLPVSPRKKGSWSWRKIKSGDFSSPAL